MIKSLLSLASVLTLLLTFVACGGAADCVAGELQCSGTQTQTCGEDGTWGAAEDCSGAGESCMTMTDGTEHCMAGMGDDDDSSTDRGEERQHDLGALGDAKRFLAACELASRLCS